MFFKALNPASEQSGIIYTRAYLKNCQNQEMLDQTLSEHLKGYLREDMSFAQLIDATYHLIVGTHYDFTLTGKDDCIGGKKGILDWLILPLLARKLIADCDLPERRTTYVANILAYLIALPIELARHTVGLALTALLILPALLIKSISSCFGSSSASQENKTSPTPLAQPS